MSAEARVLIVEDEVDVAEAYAKVLGDTYNVVTVHTGEAALEQLDGSVDVVLLDRRLPDIPGDKVLERMDKALLCCRVVMVTAVEPTLDIVEMDFDEYLVKPVTNEELKTVVEQMVLRNERDGELQEMIAVATKLATLETKLDIAQLEQSEEYERLMERYTELDQRIDDADRPDDMYLSATREKVRALLDDI